MKKNNFFVTKKIDMKNWKEIKIEYFDREFSIKVPNHCEILEMKPISLLSNPRQKIEEAFRSIQYRNESETN